MMTDIETGRCQHICECGPGERKLSVFVLRFESEKAPKGKHLTSGEKTRKRTMKNKNTNNYETEQKSPVF